MRELNLEVAPGQVYGFLGPNGSGKSTTLKIILGLVSPSSGSTEIFGRDSREVGSREAVGFLPESPVLLQISDWQLRRFGSMENSADCAARGCARASTSCSISSA